MSTVRHRYLYFLRCVYGAKVARDSVKYLYGKFLLQMMLYIFFK